MNALLRLYPPAWRLRYGDEMEALLEARPPDPRAWLDLARGALDAWMHPPAPSRAPIVAALVGGGLWTVVATAVLVQPAPPDWPGYLAEVVPLAFVAAICLLVAATGCLLRAGESRRRAIGVAAGLMVPGYLAWVAMLGATILGMVGGPELAAAQAVAMVGTVAVGLTLVRIRDEPIGFLLIAAPVAMLVPSTVAWLAFGLAWTVIGIALLLDRAARIGTPGDRRSGSDLAA